MDISMKSKDWLYGTFSFEGTEATEVYPVNVEGGEVAFPLGAFEDSDRDGKEDESCERPAIVCESGDLWNSFGMGKREGKAEWVAREGRERVRLSFSVF